MERYLLALALVPSVAGCDLGFNLTGLGDAFSCTDCWDVGGGGGGSGPSSGYYSGRIWVGPYSVVEGEATVYAYDPSNLTVPIDSAVSRDQGCSRLLNTSCVPGYDFDFRRAPPAVVCGYLARVVLWNGESSELAPLFPTAPTPCDSLSTPGAARNYPLPAYSPLDTPFALEGSVLIDGEPAGGGVRVDVHTRPTAADSVSACPAWSFFSVRQDRSVPPPLAECVPVYTDVRGHFVYSTTDPAQLFVLCDLAIARVSLEDTRVLQTELESTSLSTCSKRSFADLRFGSRQAARGTVRVDGERWATAGEAYVELFDPVRSTTVGERSWTLDDGSFLVWIPDDYIVETDCVLNLRAAHVGGGSTTDTDPYLSRRLCNGDPSHGGSLRLFELSSASP